MGEAVKSPLRFQFDRRRKLKIRGAAIPASADLSAFREVDETFGLTWMAGRTLSKGRVVKISIIGSRTFFARINSSGRLNGNCRFKINSPGVRRRALFPKPDFFPKEVHRHGK